HRAALLASRFIARLDSSARRLLPVRSHRRPAEQRREEEEDEPSARVPGHVHAPPLSHLWIASDPDPWEGEGLFRKRMSVSAGGRPWVQVLLRREPGRAFRECG